ncbi:MFS transporter [Pandoraea sputorum]|uniref:Proline porter II n=2 Tax=Pandoraea sputorum TaxID=93222 RepID=A0A239SPQ4_9BURK|nr:Proline porter II [Pandoraea sputorum]VVE50879.1 MFS transporter [Pandoraea sputorum]VVE85469.1 MFS transporter [Pandoraea sputorum]
MSVAAEISDDMRVGATDSDKKRIRRAVLTSVIGQILEWYDFFLYGTAAASVFGTIFFPIGVDPLTGTIAAFGGLAAGFVARPLGGILCGHFGDKYGRRAVMMLTLGAMGSSTFLMGLIPSYAQIGLAAPVLLVALRLVQGLAAGGEWSGSILLISENAPQHKRARLSAWSPSGAVIGFALSTGAFMLAQRFSGENFLTWGWRVPFLLSLVMIGIGVYLRSHIAESADFAKISKEGKIAHAPLVDVLRTCPGRVLMVFGLRLGEGTASWIFFAFSIAFGKFSGISDQLVYSGLIISMLLSIPVSLFSGYVSDIVGRKPVYLVGAVGIVALAYPFFALFQTGTTSAVMTALILANSLVLGTLQGAQPAFISELLPPRLRYSGLGIGRELSSVLGAGFAPVIATALLAHYRTIGPIALYLAALGMVTVVATLIAPETYPRDARMRDRLA